MYEIQLWLLIIFPIKATKIDHIFDKICSAFPFQLLAVSLAARKCPIAKKPFYLFALKLVHHFVGAENSHLF